jgi:DNA-directed RNA polymerase subunit K/omega
MSNRFISLEQKFKAAAQYVKSLHADRQVDIDSNGEPVVIGIEEIADQPNLIRVFIKRNNKKENFVISKRARKAEPIKKSFDSDDGFRRSDSRPVEKKKEPATNEEKSNGERSYRVSNSEDYEELIRTLMRNND